MELLLSANIGKLRRAHGMTQEQLAEALGVTFASVSKWERGAATPDLRFLTEMADLFGVSLDAIVGFEVRDGSTFTLSSLLADGIIEVSAVRTPVKLEGMEARSLLHDHMIAVSASPLSVSQNRTIQLQHLTQLPLILYRRYESFILDAFHAKGLSPQIFCVCDDARDALLWVKNRLATAIFPNSMQELCDGLHLYDIADPSLNTDILLVWQKNRRPSQTLREFLKICKTDS